MAAPQEARQPQRGLFRFYQEEQSLPTPNIVLEAHLVEKRHAFLTFYCMSGLKGLVTKADPRKPASVLRLNFGFDFPYREFSIQVDSPEGIEDPAPLDGEIDNHRLFWDTRGMKTRRFTDGRVRMQKPWIALEELYFRQKVNKFSQSESMVWLFDGDELSEAADSAANLGEMVGAGLVTQLEIVNLVGQGFRWKI